MQYKQLAQQFKDCLSVLYQPDEVQSLFLYALNHFLKFSNADYLLRKEEKVTVEYLAKFETVLSELQSGKPIQYIMGETFFYGLPFKVNPSVLIPRPETEELVDWILSVCREKDSTSGIENIIDIGTGSGCIAICLKKNLPSAHVQALDIAADTLKTAKENAVLNGVVIDFIEDDILKTTATDFAKPFTVIVSNPPYIKVDEMGDMHQNVLANEPHRALFVSNENPLIFYEAIANFALINLSKDGLLFFEINEYLGEQTVNLLKDKGFVNIELKKDMQGKDRMIKASVS